MRSLAAVTVAVILVTGITGCDDDPATGNGETAVATSSAPTAPATPAGPKGPNDALLWIPTSGLSNFLNPCEYAQPLTVNKFKNPLAGQINLANDLWTPAKNVPVRQCLSSGDMGAGLTVTTVRDNPGDDTAYNAIGDLYPDKKEIDADAFAVRKGYYIMGAKGTLGVVVKTRNDVNVVYKFGAPVTSIAGLQLLVKEAVAGENILFPLMMAEAQSGVVLPQR